MKPNGSSKKLWLLVLVAMLVLSAFAAGCGGGGQQSSSPSPSASTPSGGGSSGSGGGSSGSGAGSPSPSPQSSPAEQKPIRTVTMATLPVTDSAAVALAQQQGIFAKYGLEVKFNIVSTGRPPRVPWFPERRNFRKATTPRCSPPRPTTCPS